MGTFRALDLFGDWREHVCCVCCEGHCVGMDSDPGTDDTLYRLRVNGEFYITNRYYAVHADLVTDIPNLSPVEPAPTQMTVPETKPVQSTAPLSAEYVHRITGLGFDICDGDSATTYQHLYLDGKHVGWLMPVLHRPEGFKGASSSMLLADLDVIKDMAGRDAGLWTIHGTADKWAIAAGLLNAHRALTAWEATS